jgi:micrococcal nuclease
LAVTRFRVVVVAILAATSAGGWWLGQERRTAGAEYRVVAVVDGDTIEVARGHSTETVRLLGIDTPETEDPDEPVECFGPEAAEYTASRLAGATVRLEGDVESHDRYGRRLAYVILDGERFNDELLRLGYAELLVIEPNHAHARTLLAAELEARRDGRGLWGAC